MKSRSPHKLSHVPPQIESFVCVCGVVTPAAPFVCVTVCCSVLQCVAMWKCRDSRYSICVCGTCVEEEIFSKCVALCCSVLQCVASVLQCVAVCCSVLQCVAVCCSVLQCVECVEEEIFNK